MKKPMTVMLIDDSSSSNLYHKIMMEEAGINIDSCVSEYISSIEAKNHFQAIYNANNLDGFPDVILLDINIPIMSGWEMITFLENLELGNHQPRIFMVSNSRSPIDLEKAEKTGMVEDILEKHVEQEFFEQLLKEHSE